VPGTKTVAAARSIELLPLLRDELATRAASATRRDSDAYLFAIRTGGKQQPSNVRRRVLAPAVERASDTLAGRGLEPLPSHLTPHSMRRSYASLLFALGEAPPYVMSALGHRSPP
jgi:integrase